MASRRKPRPVIVKFTSNKTKTRILTKWCQLKGKPQVIMEDMASDLVKREKELKWKESIENTWLSNGKLKYKLKDDQRVKEIQSWQDLNNLD